MSWGFRPGRVPAHILRGRRFGLKARRHWVERADAAWVHGRGRDPRFALLRSKRVVILGCGSVGAPVALMLAQAGVGALELFDPDDLSYANVGRHPLGARSVGRGKAIALAEHMRERFPHVLEVRGYQRTWQNALQADPSFIERADLIVSAMGHWPSEGALNEWCVASGRTVKVLYGWAEAHACAGHAVLVGPEGGCLQCGLDAHGAPRLEVTKWVGGATQEMEPGCAALYQPYGPVELSHVTSLIAELALDALIEAPKHSVQRIWAARQGVLNRTGGKWSDAWLALGAPETGGEIRELPWVLEPSCIECGNLGGT